jgi:EAL domain-containing protein (putative c-di-GMP-specific phosphodiesterase class I)
LDDFGTGYSNQSNIMQYPYSIVKIDKSLVWACDSNPKAFISLKHTVAMIKDLEMSVLAEGVESDEHKKLLEEIGVEYLQGFYFSKPLPPAETISFLEKNN